MPWSGKSFKKHNKSLPPAAADKASSIANAVLKKSGDEGMAIAVANKKIKDMRKRGAISDKAAERNGLEAQLAAPQVGAQSMARSGLDVSNPPRDLDATTR